MSKLVGKVAVVTGASKGIGAGVAKALAAAEPSRSRATSPRRLKPAQSSTPPSPPLAASTSW
jgi:NAD(P)-dependent dehydrogenase (short-subunit alcohol dehydrogenase family)